jgi:hypothetical protein
MVVFFSSLQVCHLSLEKFPGTLNSLFEKLLAITFFHFLPVSFFVHVPFRLLNKKGKYTEVKSEKNQLLLK